MIRTLALALAAAAVLAAPAAAAGSKKTVAVVTHGHVRAVVTAHRTSGGGAPTASMTVTGYRAAAGGGWRPTATHLLSGTYFWKTVTAPRGVCRVRLAGTKLTLSLLVTPSIGCSTPRTITLK